MKILVVQLARLGDIVQSWPTIKALRRLNQNAQIDLLVRDKFKGAIFGIERSVNRTILMNSSELLQPIICESCVDGSVQRMEAFADSLAKERYDLVVNISFSPFSSYLCEYLESEGSAEIKGYSRHSDGYLDISDDASSYFYAQGGTDKFSRIHLIDIFAMVAGVDLDEQDWDFESCFEGQQSESPLDDEYILVHPSASNLGKTLNEKSWAKVITGLSDHLQEKIVLVGSPDERERSEKILSFCPNVTVENRVGGTNLRQLSRLIKDSRLVIGGDSLAMQFGSMFGTPCLNLSCSRVNFWETGPISKRSRVIYEDDIENIGSERVCEEAKRLLREDSGAYPIYAAQVGHLERYLGPEAQNQDFIWKLIKALYLQQPYPVLGDEIGFLCMMRLREVAQLALQQFADLSDMSKTTSALEVLNQVDSLIENLYDVSPLVQPIINWFQTQRLRIPPGSSQEVLQRTKMAFNDLNIILQVYIADDLLSVKGDTNANTSIYR